MTAVGYFRVLAGTTTWTCSVVEMSGSKQLSGLSLHIFRWALRFILKVFGRKPLTPHQRLLTGTVRNLQTKLNHPTAHFGTLNRARLKAKGGGRCYKQ